MSNEEKTKTTALAEARKQFCELFEKEAVAKQLNSIATKYMKPERLVKIIRLAASRQPKLYYCTTESLLTSAMLYAQLGIDCSGTLGRGYLVPFFNGKIKKYECVPIIGFQGLKELALRSGSVSKIEAHAVYEKDMFEYQYGLEQKLTHKPYVGNGSAGEIRGAYAFATPKEGEPIIEYMSKHEIDGIRARSKAKDSGPWVTDYSEMCRKTVVRRLCKYLELKTDDFQEALIADDTQFNGYDLTAPELPPEAPKQSTAKRIASKIKDTKAVAKEETMSDEELVEKTEKIKKQVQQLKEEAEQEERQEQWLCKNCGCTEPPSGGLCVGCNSIDIEKVE